jgi:orotidine-5'-phosphate decarboxylase
MLRSELISEIKKKKSFLCVGLDTEWNKIPEHLLDLEDPILAFNQQIIDATEDLCVAYKPNTAFYESRGVQGWRTLQNTWQYLPKNCLSIADAKRGDIGNTANQYATAFFDEKKSGMGFDALTIAPYMGKDSIEPFLNHPDKWAIVLALTSNAGGKDFQLIQNKDGVALYEEVLKKVTQWGTPDQLMFVVGATRPEYFKQIRQYAPDHFLLVPGVGAQGGDLREVCQFGLTHEIGLLINATRSIIYASNGKDFAEKAREEAISLQQEMQAILEEAQII